MNMVIWFRRRVVGRVGILVGVMCVVIVVRVSLVFVFIIVCISESGFIVAFFVFGFLRFWRFCCGISIDTGWSRGFYRGF